MREQVVPLEQAIRSATGLPADILGMSNRGYLRRDYVADVIVWDPNRLADTATFETPHRYSIGIEYVFVNGRVALAKGTPTGALVGSAVRKRGEERG